MQQDSAIHISGLNKTYANGFGALSNINLDIKRGEIFALLGPNGAGKTTLISTVCGIVQPTSGRITVAGFDSAQQYRAARAALGLVPQEISTDAFESVWNTVSFSRGLFGKPRNDAYIQDVLKRLSLWDKKDEQIRRLSGGMKRRVMIAKALSHEPSILFLDEPSAGVDVELRKSMWAQVRALRDAGVTIILTTHYLEEAEEMADRIGVINKGKLILVEDKHTIMQKMGKRQMIFVLRQPLATLPATLHPQPLVLDDDGSTLTWTYDAQAEIDISAMLDQLQAAGIRPKDIYSRQSNLEEIFMELVEAV
ncbi:ABC transporter ATP-binding protein [Parvibium lacunae]|uniref:ABC transporter ATP-binding protein n=1 Tax=Parvibium lacunae TaxID=1888893 RepID=A0A368L6E3_9BURK|nr:ABC transporter ATP-binding protein [Parvibium lacunae]RCS59223.1 ABC transporter ATP-binding protein [Parvibium lacunae]